MFLARRILVVCCITLFIPTVPHLFAQTVSLRISVDNSADHVQTLAIKEFAEQLIRESGGRIGARVFHSGELFRDPEVIPALRDGRIEMAVPGTWHVSRYVPDVAVFLLPHFFGRTAPFVHAYSDGEVGERLTALVESAIDVIVPGRWLDLGPGHLYFVDNRVTNHQEIADLVIRVAGGRGNELRVAAFGAVPVSVAWNDLPQYLELRRVDGILTTHESVRSGRLWRYGITDALEDNQYFPQYVPMIRRSFWDTLSTDDQQLIRSLWENIVEDQRTAAAEAQSAARGELIQQGIRIRTLSEARMDASRGILMSQQAEIANQLGISPTILSLLNDATY